jgi:hypothetical protein
MGNSSLLIKAFPSWCSNWHAACWMFSCVLLSRHFGWLFVVTPNFLTTMEGWVTLASWSQSKTSYVVLVSMFYFLHEITLGTSEMKLSLFICTVSQKLQKKVGEISVTIWDWLHPQKCMRSGGHLESPHRSALTWKLQIRWLHQRQTTFHQLLER